MLHIVLFQPEIPQNTGNVGRMCALTKSRLHLIHPLGFTITDRHLKRAGMDYWHSLDVHHHDNWQVFRASAAGPMSAAATLTRSSSCAGARTGPGTTGRSGKACDAD